VAFTESEVIALLAQVFAAQNPKVEIGIGDDAAVLHTSARTVITTDMAVEGVHFRRDWSTPFEIGRKVTAANLADVFAMGAKPTFLVVAVSLTGNEELSWIQDLAKGIVFEAGLGGATVVGGDLAKGESVVVSITALGEVDTAILRSGAKIGDQIFLSNLPGWSRAGLTILEKVLTIESDFAKRAVMAFKAPTINYEFAAQLIDATSMSDLSDSLVTQAEQMAIASGVNFTIDFDLVRAIPEFADLIKLAAEIEVNIEDLILGGGEDHVFIATGKNLPGLVIGEVSVGSGLKLLGNEKAPDTWRHFD
jgi:thiamine-monophosphate kinase